MKLKRCSREDAVDCFACRRLGDEEYCFCSALEDTYFKYPCPFYKKARQVMKEELNRREELRKLGFKIVNYGNTVSLIPTKNDR